MAVRVTKELICDLCGRDGDVVRFRITKTSTKDSVQVDLCVEHREIIEEVMKRRKQARRVRRVYTPEEIEAQRRTAKKAAKRPSRKR